MIAPPLAFYEFFAGGGMARAGLGQDWRCLFANDFDAGKAQTYRANWGGGDLVEGDVWAVEPGRLPGRADLAWASSPCQDLSLAGKRAGLSGARSSAFWGFWRLVEALNREGRAPRTVVIENVAGLLTSHCGEDFTALCEALAREGYRFGGLEIDAALFLPQSRPRVFVVASREPAVGLDQGSPATPFHSRRITEVHARLPGRLQQRWVWWRLDPPPARNLDLAAVLEPDAVVAWHGAEHTTRLICQLGPVHRRKLATAQAARERQVAGLYRRMRLEHGVTVQRAELRFDGLAGCLRTPGGGSSRQTVVIVEGARVRTRPLSAREAARLMGLPDAYVLPATSTAALHLVGDGVAVPVVRHLAERLLQPLLAPADLRVPLAAA